MNPKDSELGASILESAQLKNKSADPEFVKLCIRTITNKLQGKISKEQFWNEELPKIERMADRLMKQKGIAHPGDG